MSGRFRTTNGPTRLIAAAWALSGLLVGAHAAAASLSPLDSRLATSPGAPIGPATAYAVDRTWGAPIGIAGLYTSSFGNTFTSAQTAIIPITTSITPNGFSFYDNYFFSVGPSVANTSATTITLAVGGTTQGIDQLEARLYRVGDAGTTQGPLYYGTVPGGAYQAWTLVSGITQTAIIENALLAAGTWTLEVRGRALADGGSYGGNLNVSPVPLPAAAWLLAGALSLVAGAGWRRRDRHVPSAA